MSLIVSLPLAGDGTDLDVNDYILGPREENGQRLFDCKICSKPSVRRSTIKRHLLTVHATYLESRAADKTDLDHAKPRVEDDIDFDELKPSSAGDETDLDDVDDHILGPFEEDGERIFKCKMCSKPSVRRATIKRHLLTVHATFFDSLPRATDKSNPGDETDLDDVDDYILGPFEEDGERLFKCKICSKPSVRRATIKRHLLSVHSAASNEPCQFCNRTFKNIYAMISHQSSSSCRAKKDKLKASQKTPTTFVNVDSLP